MTATITDSPRRQALPAFDGTQPCNRGLLDDPAYFDPTATEVAKRACATCPFLDPCRAYGLANDVRGVWGGYDDAERAAIRIAHDLPEPTPVSDLLDDLVRQFRAHPPTGQSDPGPRRVRSRHASLEHIA